MRHAFAFDEQRAILDAIGTWITTAQREGYEPLSGWTNAYAEVMHSALLRRLLSGKEPLPEKPPLKYAYPDYPD